MLFPADMADTSVSKSLAVVAGEASESDDENTLTSAIYRTPLESGEQYGVIPIGTVISGEASESDDESNIPLNIQTSLQVEIATAIDAASLIDTEQKAFTQPKYNSLLHKKLREANCSIHSELDGFMRRQFDAATKSLKNTAQQLAASQIVIQEVSNSMRLVTNDLFQLEDKIDIITACNILPDVKIPART